MTRLKRVVAVCTIGLISATPFLFVVHEREKVAEPEVVLPAPPPDPATIRQSFNTYPDGESQIDTSELPKSGIRP